ncbi:MAG: hypothetical protein AB7V24_14025 [Steroidobacteraceae bacterium]
MLACALSAKAAVIVSGEHDLVDLGTFNGIRILSAAQAQSVITAGAG